MNKRGTIIVIVEGKDYEKRVIHNIKENFFNKRLGSATNYEVCELPVGENIYMLWKQLKALDFEADVVEVVKDMSDELKNKLQNYSRNDVSEIYLFFDYDKHQENLPRGENPTKVLNEMLNTFDNETENGKLYISYPMAEAIRDYVPGTCYSVTGSCYLNNVGREYKEITGQNNNVSDINKNTLNDWRNILSCYVGRLSCLAMQDIKDYSSCKQHTPEDIFTMQVIKKMHHPNFIVLSAFPEFIIDYFEAEHLKEMLPFVLPNMCDEKFNS